MNKKQIIQLIIILAAFGGAGIVLYKGGIFGSPSSNTVTLQAGVVTGSQPILPYGESLDFTQAIDKKRFDYNQFEFSKLAPNEVGISVDNLIIPEEGR